METQREPDISKYSYEECIEILKVIDKERYPKRVSRLEERIRQLDEANKNTRSNERISSGSVLLGRIVYPLFFVFFSYECYGAILTGEVHVYSRLSDSNIIGFRDSPIAFVIRLGVGLFLALVTGIASWDNWFKQKRV